MWRVSRARYLSNETRPSFDWVNDRRPTSYAIGAGRSFKDRDFGEGVIMASDGLFDALPEAELHIHIEGSLEPLMMLTLAACNGVELHDVNRDEGLAASLARARTA